MDLGVTMNAAATACHCDCHIVTWAFQHMSVVVAPTETAVGQCATAHSSSNASSTEAMSKQPTEHCTLLDLPDPVLAGIAKLSRDWRRNPLLRVSTSCRDAVLTNASHVDLTLTEQDKDSPEAGGHAYQPQARLLDRACRQAAHGLSLGLRISSSDAYRLALLQLLQPGLNNGGYPAVHELQVRLQMRSVVQR
jgi:hypothetical protein